MWLQICRCQGQQEDNQGQTTIDLFFSFLLALRFSGKLRAGG